MITKPEKYTKWDEFKILDSEAQFWTHIREDIVKSLAKEEGLK